MKLHSLTILLSVVYSVNGFKRVCYYTNWSQSRPAGGRFTPEDIDPYLCTHIIFAYGRIVGDEIMPSEWNDESSPQLTGQYERVTSLKSINPDLKILLGVTGWNTVSLLASWPNAEPFRAKFVDSTITFLRRRNFDGIDLNWALPTARRVRPVKRDIFTNLLEELKNGFDEEANATGKTPLLLTAAVSAEWTEIDNRYDAPTLSRLLEFMSVVTFDLQGPWLSTLEHHSPLFPRQQQIGDDRYKNVEEAMSHWVDRGVPRSKLLVGIPFYGQSFSLLSTDRTEMGDPDLGDGPASHYTMQNGFMSYYEVCELINNGATQKWHKEHRVPFLINSTTWVAYDDHNSIIEKTNWLKSNRFAGAAVWALDLDDFWGDFCDKGPYPLLHTVYDQLNLKRDTSNDNKVESIAKTFTSDLGLGQQMAESVQGPVKQSTTEEDSGSSLIRTISDLKTSHSESLPTKEQLAIINGGMKSYDSSIRKDGKIKSEYDKSKVQQEAQKTVHDQTSQQGAFASNIGITNLKEPRLGSYTEMTLTNDLVSGTDRIKSPTDLEHTFTSTGMNSEQSIGGSTKSKLSTAETAGLTETTSNDVNSVKPPISAEDHANPQKFGKKQDFADNSINSEMSSTRSRKTDKTAFYLDFQLRNTINRNMVGDNQIISGNAPTGYIADMKSTNNIVSNMGEGNADVRKNEDFVSNPTKSEMLRKGAMKADKGVLAVDSQDRNTLNTNAFENDVFSNSASKESKSQLGFTEGSRTSVQQGVSYLTKETMSNLQDTPSPMVVGSELATNDESNAAERNITHNSIQVNKLKSQNAKSSSGKVIILPINPIKLVVKTEEEQRNQGVTISTPSNRETNSASHNSKRRLNVERNTVFSDETKTSTIVGNTVNGIDVSTAERNVYDIFPTIRDAVPKAMTSFEEITYAEKIDKRQKDSERATRNKLPDGVIFRSKKTDRTILKGGTQAGTLSSNAGTGTLRIESLQSKQGPVLNNRSLFDVKRPNKVHLNRPGLPENDLQAKVNATEVTKSKAVTKPKRKVFSIDKNIPMNNKFSSNLSKKDRMSLTNEFGVPYSTLCKYYWYVICFDHINRVYIHGEDWETLKGVYVKPENYTTTPDPTEIIVHHNNHTNKLK